jgi:hypothetical protein
VLGDIRGANCKDHPYLGAVFLRALWGERTTLTFEGEHKRLGLRFSYAHDVDLGSTHPRPRLRLPASKQSAACGRCVTDQLRVLRHRVTRIYLACTINRLARVVWQSSDQAFRLQVRAANLQNRNGESEEAALVIGSCYVIHRWLEVKNGI